MYGFDEDILVSIGAMRLWRGKFGKMSRIDQLNFLLRRIDILSCLRTGTTSQG